ncbi:MAG: inositol monophosphatase family protein [Pseudomonadota bacterium]
MAPERPAGAEAGATTPDEPKTVIGADADALADRDLLLASGAEAGGIALDHARRLKAGTLRVTEKPGGQGPVTEADLAVDAHLTQVLRAARPGYGWLSEETADGPDRLRADRVFIVDPIDGTRAFIAGERGWAVALAVVTGGRVTAAAVVLPARGETYAAALGAGATLDGVPLAGSGRKMVEGARILAARPTFAAEHWPGGVPAIKREFRPSLAWRICLAASGRFDGMATIRPCWEWDVAAGALIAAEAGLTVSDADGAEPVFNRAPPRTAGMLVAPPKVHRGLMAGRQAAAAR